MIFDLKDLFSHLVEEVSVVRHDHDRAFICMKELLQPLQHPDVEVVRRLVQKQDVRLFHKEARKRQPCSLSSGQCADLLVVVFLVKSHTGQYAAHLAFIREAAHILIAFLQIAVAFKHRFIICGIGSCGGCSGIFGCCSCGLCGSRRRSCFGGCC